MSIIKKIEEKTVGATSRVYKLNLETMEEIFGKDFRKSIYHSEGRGSYLLFEENNRFYYTKVNFTNDSNRFEIWTNKSNSDQNNFVFYQPLGKEDIRYFQNYLEYYLHQTKILTKVLSHTRYRIRRELH